MAVIAEDVCSQVDLELLGKHANVASSAVAQPCGLTGRSFRHESVLPSMVCTPRIDFVLDKANIRSDCSRSITMIALCLHENMPLRCKVRACNGQHQRVP